MKESCVPPFKSLVHWDNKTTETLDSANYKIRLTILVSGNKKLKLLGVPSIGTKLDVT